MDGKGTGKCRGRQPPFKSHQKLRASEPPTKMIEEEVIMNIHHEEEAANEEKTNMIKEAASRHVCRPWDLQTFCL